MMLRTLLCVLAPWHSGKGLKKRRGSPLHVEELERRNLLSVFTPAQITHAYGFDQVTFAAGSVRGDGTGQTIAVVDAYDDPNIASDLQAFDSRFSLPAANFTKATPEGLPATDTGWSIETSLDVEWAHAVAPGANILLVEANSNSLTDLLNAVTYAANQPGVSVVSMSWGSSEFKGETSMDGYFVTPSGHNGVTFVASSGDSGAPPSWPAVSPNVLAVGGTTLNLAANGSYGSETAWNDSSGGISRYESKPAYQTDVTTPSSRYRTNPDVAYNANPSTGVYVYDSFNGGWWDVGGTSAGAPQWAGLVAIADQGRALAHQGTLDGPSQTLYAIYEMASTSYSTDYHDITKGSNGYSAGKGYDLVTGLGSPVANQVIGGLVGWTGTGKTGSLAATGSAGQASPHDTATPVAVPVLLNGANAPQLAALLQNTTDLSGGGVRGANSFSPGQAPFAAGTILSGDLRQSGTVRVNGTAVEGAQGSSGTGGPLENAAKDVSVLPALDEDKPLPLPVRPRPADHTLPGPAPLPALLDAYWREEARPATAPERMTAVVLPVTENEGSQHDMLVALGALAVGLGGAWVDRRRVTEDRTVPANY